MTLSPFVLIGTDIHSRLGVIALEPPRRRLIRLHRPLLIPDLRLIHLGQILLMRRRAPEVALERVVVDGLLQHARRVFRVGFAVRFEGFGQAVCGVVGLVEVFGLDGSGVLEGEASFFACAVEGRGWSVGWRGEMEEWEGKGEGGGSVPCFCIRKAFAACV